MTDTAASTRSIEKRLEIDAPPEAVWEALATGKGVARWFGFDARVDDHAGGEYFVSWGPECEGAWKIDALEPPRRLVLLDEEFVPGMVQTMEYVLEADAGRTILRMTQSGIGADAKWDEMYDSMNRGWDVFMHTLRHSIERHPGEDRRLARARKKIALSRQEIWDRLTGDSGLGVSRRDDDAYVFSREHNLGGDVWIWNPPKDLAGSVTSLNDAALWIALEAGGKAIHLDMTLSAYGVDEGPVRQVQERWQTMLDSLFPSDDGE